MMNQDQANKVKQVLYKTKGWDELAKYHPKFAKAVNDLPKEENLKLVQRIREMETKAGHRLKVVFRDGAYYLKDAIDGYGEGGDGPFCGPCMDKDNTLIRTCPAPDYIKHLSGLKYSCPICGPTVSKGNDNFKK